VVGIAAEVEMTEPAEAAQVVVVVVIVIQGAL
jgi:hypothetical protein